MKGPPLVIMLMPPGRQGLTQKNSRFIKGMGKIALSAEARLPK